VTHSINGNFLTDWKRYFEKFGPPRGDIRPMSWAKHQHHVQPSCWKAGCEWAAVNLERLAAPNRQDLDCSQQTHPKSM